MIRALIAGRTRVHREALAVALSQARGVRVLGTASHREEILARLVEAIALGGVTARKEEAALSPVHELTGREREILQLVDQGMSNKQIARHLGIEVATAKNHVHNILQKLHVHRRIDASSWYRQGGFHLKLEA